MSVDTARDTASDARVRWEIWRSFQSLIKAYAAILTSEGSSAPKVQAISDYISVDVRSMYLGFHFNPADGGCEWSHKGSTGLQMSGRFKITMEGMVSFEGGGEHKDMDHAAIDFLSLLREERVPTKNAG